MKFSEITRSAFSLTIMLAIVSTLSYSVYYTLSGMEVSTSIDIMMAVLSSIVLGVSGVYGLLLAISHLVGYKCD